MIPIEWSDSKYIVASSMFFQLPAYYAYRHALYVHATTSFMTSLLSINYWRHGYGVVPASFIL
jgi:hypothetical protein